MSKHSDDWFKYFSFDTKSRDEVRRMYGGYDDCSDRIKKIASRPAFQYTSLEVGKIGKQNIHK